MPALQVRDFPAELYEELREYANRNHRSIAQQTIACVERELSEDRRRRKPTGIGKASARADGSEPTEKKHGKSKVSANETLSEEAHEAESSTDAAAQSSFVDDFDTSIPPNVRKATAQARSVDPFDWLGAFRIESDTELEARREKRRKLFENMAELDKRWKGPKPTCDEIVAMIREDRDNRANSIIENAERYAELMGEGKPQ